MSTKIGRDYERFKKIVRGKVRDELHKHITKGAMEGMRGGKKISIPVPVIDLPHFKYGQGDEGGIGTGDGEEGDTLGFQPGDGDDGEGKAGKDPGEHMVEVEVSIEELVDMIFEDMKLPRIKEKGKKNIMEKVYKYTGLSRSGPESLRHNKRTFKQALKRSISMGDYNPDKPVIIPVREDKRYRSRKPYFLPKANAVIIYMMDVSGSMGGEQKEIARTESYLIDRWLQKNYDGLESRYITHDAAAREVDRELFFSTSESGGTMISSAYRLCADIIKSDYPPSQYNIYAFHFSDGDNWSSDDTRLSTDILEQEMLAEINMFGYCQIHSPHGSGSFIKDLKDLEETYHPALILSEVKDMEGIKSSIMDFFNPENET